MPSYLGQNFLTDESVKQYIYDQLLDIQKQFDLINCIEIGPGKGSLTVQLLQIFQNIRLIEKDPLMKSHINKIIKASPNVLIQLDMIDVLEREEESGFAKPQTLIYGSLPYYITSPIMDKFMIKLGYHFGLFITQLEFGQRIQTQTNKKSYFWRLLNNYFNIYIRKIIGPNCFTPPPKVSSCLLWLQRKEKSELKEQEYVSMLDILDKISQFKRKTLGKISKISDVKIPQDLLHKRLEEITRSEMKEIIAYQ